MAKKNYGVNTTDVILYYEETKNGPKAVHNNIYISKSKSSDTMSTFRQLTSNSLDTLTN